MQLNLTVNRGERRKKNLNGEAGRVGGINILYYIVEFNFSYGVVRIGEMVGVGE